MFDKDAFDKDAEKNAELNRMALYFKKRRFDGGSEVELIAQIEKQHMHHMALGRAMSQAMSQELLYALPSKSGLNPAQQARLQARVLERQARRRDRREAAVAASKVPCTKTQTKKSILGIFLTGPLQLTVGVIGIVTLAIAKLASGPQSNPMIKAQCQKVWQDSKEALLQGIGTTLFSPFLAVKQVFVGA